MYEPQRYLKKVRYGKLHHQTIGFHLGVKTELYLENIKHEKYKKYTIVRPTIFSKYDNFGEGAQRNRNTCRKVYESDGEIGVT